MVSVSREKVKRDWAQRGFSCGLWADPPGQVWANFVHDTDELVRLPVYFLLLPAFSLVFPKARFTLRRISTTSKGFTM